MTVAVGEADLHEAINKIWDESGLDTEFKNLWKRDVRDSQEFPTLHDQQAGPDQPFPYCVYEIRAGVTVSRMTSSSKTGRREIRDNIALFRIHAKEQDKTSAKKIASDLLDSVLQVYGGHPTVSPRSLDLNYGNFLLAQYQNDYGIRTGAEEYQWILEYVMRLDVPVAA